MEQEEVTNRAHERYDLCCPYCRGHIRPDWQSDGYGFGFRCEGCTAHWDADGDLMNYPKPDFKPAFTTRGL